MPKSAHWGEWIAARAKLLGYLRQLDLAKEIGCSDDQLSRWIHMANPPSRMRKGFDKSLARALETTPDVLFIDYADLEPEKVFRVYAVPDELFPSPNDPSMLFSEPLEKTLRDVLIGLHDSELEDVVQFAIRLVLSKNDTRRPQFERFYDRHFLRLDGTNEAKHNYTKALKAINDQRAARAVEIHLQREGAAQLNVSTKAKKSKRGK